MTAIKEKLKGDTVEGMGIQNKDNQGSQCNGGPNVPFPAEDDRTQKDKDHNHRPLSGNLKTRKAGIKDHRQARHECGPSSGVHRQGQTIGLNQESPEEEKTDGGNQADV
jgi:hypothetical protein